MAGGFQPEVSSPSHQQLVSVDISGPTQTLGVCGDQNDDGLVNILDVIIDLQITVGLLETTPGQQFLGDLDGAVNILIFLPFGGFLAVWLRGRLGWWGTATVVGGVALGFSAAIELVQYLSLVRTSSWLDVVNNSVGAAMGALAIHLPRFSRGDS